MPSNLNYVAFSLGLIMFGLFATLFTLHPSWIYMGLAFLGLVVSGCELAAMILSKEAEDYKLAKAEEQLASRSPKEGPGEALE